MGAEGSFDSFNPLPAKDVAPEEIGLTSATLMTSSEDEPFSQYPFIAESIERIGKTMASFFISTRMQNLRMAHHHRR